MVKITDNWQAHIHQGVFHLRANDSGRARLPVPSRLISRLEEAARGRKQGTESGGMGSA